MSTDDDKRAAEQELAAGRSESTPIVALGTVTVVIAVLVIVTLALATIAYLAA